MCFLLLWFAYGFICSTVMQVVAASDFTDGEGENVYFLKHIEHITARTGEKVTFTCSIANLGKHKVSWIHKDTDTQLTVQNRGVTLDTRITATKSKGKRNWKLHIEDVNESDSGEYICQINTSPPKSQTGYLTVISATNREDVDVVFVTPIENITTETGRKVTFTCTIANLGEYKVSWFHKITGNSIQLTVQNRVISKDDRISLSKKENREWKLHIHNVDERDSGEYMCEVNTLPSKSQSGYLKVVMPTFPISIENVTVESGENITLKCIIDNLGKYKVSWHRVDEGLTRLTINKNILINNERIGVSHKDNTWQLHIFNVEVSDSGAYRCETNTKPERYITGFLNVLTPPEIDGGNSSSNTQVDEGSEVSLRCAVSGIPTSQIEWKRVDNADIIIGSTNVKSVYGEYLNFSNVNRHHMGIYHCIASNGISAPVTKEIELTVRFPPSVWTTEKLIETQLGHDATIECIAQAYPLPITYWVHNKAMLYSSKRHENIVHTKNFTTSNRFRICELIPQDFGIYMCIAINSSGKNYTSLKVLTNETLIYSCQSSTYSTSKFEIIFQILLLSTSYVML